MSIDNKGLSIQEAWAAAEAEGSLSGETLEPTDIAPAEPAQVSDGEQPQVESQTRSGLFSDLSDEEGQLEQPEEGLHEVTVNGEKSMVSLDELIAGYQRQKYTTQVQQEVSELRREAEDALTLMRALQENPQSTVRMLWEAVAKGEDPMPKVDHSPRGMPQSQSPDIDALVAAKVNEALASDPRIRAWEDASFEAEINAQFDRIAKDWNLDSISEEDREVVLQEAVKAGNPDIESVFAKLMHKKSLKDSERENAFANSSSQGYGSQGPAVVAAPAKPEKFSSFREAMNSTLAEEGVTPSALDQIVSNLGK